MDQRKRLIQLRDEWLHCKKCGLHKNRGKSPIVFGAGNPEATYFFLYEAPSEADEAVSSPLQGESGVMFSDLMQGAGIDKKDCYATPVVACRPQVLLPGTADNPERWATRAAQKEEVETCSDRVRQLIYAVDPVIVFTMGDLAWKHLVRPKDRGIVTRLEVAVGDIFLTRMPGIYHHEITYPVIPLLSMEHLLKNPSVATTGPITITTAHLIKGRRHATYLKTQSAKDAKQHNL